MRMNKYLSGSHDIAAAKPRCNCCRPVAYISAFRESYTGMNRLCS